MPCAAAGETPNRRSGHADHDGRGYEPHPGRPAGERVARFREFVELVSLLLRQEVSTYHGQFYRCQDAETVPLPVQRPRPPVTIAAHGRRMLRIAAGDGWSSRGGYDVAVRGDELARGRTSDRSHLTKESAP